MASPARPRRRYLKVLMLGESGVGKTAFVRRATKDTFDPELPSTIGLDYSAFEAVLDGELWRVEIWDTAGQDRFRTIQKAYYRSADGVILVFDVSARESFEGIRHWLEEIKERAPEYVTLSLIGNKVDVPASERKVTFEEADAIAREMGAQYTEASAKTSENVREAVLDLASRCHVRLCEQWAAHGANEEKEAPEESVALDGPARSRRCCGSS